MVLKIKPGVMPDSYSPSYILLIQQEARQRFIVALDKATRANLISFIPICLRIARGWILLKYTNDLVESYLHEYNLRILKRTGGGQCE